MHLINRLQTRPFSAKVASRRKEFIVYLKRSEEIADFIVLMKAPECCLRFEDVRLSRDYANIGNRLVNLDAANMSKTTAAAERQLKETVEYFKTLLDKGYMSAVPVDKLFESGRAAFKFDGAWEVNTIYTSYPDVDIGVAPYIVGDDWNGERSST